MQVADPTHGLRTEEDGKVKTSHDIRISILFFSLQSQQTLVITPHNAFWGWDRYLLSPVKMPRIQCG